MSNEKEDASQATLAMIIQKRHERVTGQMLLRFVKRTGFMHRTETATRPFQYLLILSVSENDPNMYITVHYKI